jgi:hypothetical protein
VPITDIWTGTVTIVLRAGASLLSAGRASALTICVVRDHHERWDGLGHERGRTGADTHQFARIAAVADVDDEPDNRPIGGSLREHHPAVVR